MSAVPMRVFTRLCTPRAGGGRRTHLRRHRVARRGCVGVQRWTRRAAATSGRPPAMTSFRAERQWGVLDSETLLSYALNIYDEGNTVFSGHGRGGPRHARGWDRRSASPAATRTSVASRRARRSCRSRSATAASAAWRRARGWCVRCARCSDNGCHVVNMSYGEYTAEPETAGRFIAMAQTLVKVRAPRPPLGRPCARPPAIALPGP